VLTSSRSE